MSAVQPLPDIGRITIIETISEGTRKNDVTGVKKPESHVKNPLAESILVAQISIISVGSMFTVVVIPLFMPDKNASV
jgi:hypothetical protein